MKKEPKVNRLFAAIVIFYLAVSALFLALSAAGISVRLPVVLSLISGEMTLLLPTVFYVVCGRVCIGSVSQRWRLPVAVIPLLILLAYCILPLISLVNLISMFLGGENAAASMLGTIRQLPVWVSFLCIAVLPGVLEEFIFRGLIYSEYRKRRTWGAIFTSALLFGLMHMNLNQFCYAFVMGVIFCLLYEGTGSLTASMLVHAVYNGNSVLMTYLMDEESLMQAAGSGQADILAQMLGDGAMKLEMLLMLAGITVAALLGLAAAGGLYVAIVKLCRREKQVLQLFGRQPAAEDAASRRLWGPVLWIGVILSVGVILWGVLRL